jgi:cyclopropane fatty-acyl-phospholipid synthase-like methyltransferase
MISTFGLDISDRTLEDELEAHVGPPGYWEHQRDVQVAILNHFNVKPRHRVLEVGTGAMRGGAVITNYLDTGNFFGVEVSEERFAVGRSVIELLELEHKRPNLILSRVFGVDEIKPQSIDLVWAFQVIPHMTEEIVRQFVKAIAFHLKPNAKALFSVRLVADGPMFSHRGKWHEFPTTNMRREFLDELAAAEGLKMSLHGTLGDWGMAPALGGAKNYLAKMSRI